MEGLRAGFAGKGLISTGDGADADGEPSVDDGAATSGGRGVRCGVASGGNSDMTLGPRSPSAPACAAGSPSRIFQNANANSATMTHAAISSAAIPSRLGCDAYTGIAAGDVGGGPDDATGGGSGKSNGSLPAGNAGDWVSPPHASG